VAIELLVKNVEIGVVTTNPDAMSAFYGDVLGLPFQGSLDFPGGTMRRYSVGDNVLKLVTYHEPPDEPVAPGGGRARAGIRYLTVVVASLSDAEKMLTGAGCEIVEPRTEFTAVPGMGWLFVADPDGNWVELAGPL